MKRLCAIVIASVALLAAVPVFAASRLYASGAAQGDRTIEMEAGSVMQITLKFKNTGSYSWKGGGRNYVSLYATGPYKRKSVFRDAKWPTAYQAAKLGQATVSPGKTGSVMFTLHAPENAGTYKETFQLAVEHAAWIYGSTARFTITVDPLKVTEATPVRAPSYAVLDADSGEVLAQQNADQVRSIASITKLMTMLVAHDAGVDPEASLAISRDDEVGGGRLRVRDGTVLSVRDLIASTLIASANNAANAVARATGLSKDEFVQRMDDKAKALGLTSTSFVEPTGIQAGNVSTAKEVALLAKTAFDDSWVAEFDADPTYEVATAAGPHLIKNTNQLMKDDTIEVSGGKTGFTYEAGYSFVTRIKRDGERPLIVAVLGCDSWSQAFREAKILAEKTWLGGATAFAN